MSIIKLDGELVINTINNQLELINLNHLSDETVIDLSNISKIDTAGIAALLDLNAKSLKFSKKIKYTNVPINIQNLCKLYQITL